MPPSLAFGFIMCSYLPGIPITLSLYHTIIASLLAGSTELAFKNTFIILYVAISPLIFGIPIDAMRHGIEHLVGILSKPPKKGRCSKLKDRCVLWSHWDHLPAHNLNVDYDKGFTRHIINIYAVQYHMYEFFYNLALSCPIALLFFLIWKLFLGENPTKNVVILSAAVAVFTIISVFFGWLMNNQNDVLIKEYFPKDQAGTNMWWI